MRKPVKTLVLSLIVISLLIVVAIKLKPIINEFTGIREVETIRLTWSPGNQPLTLEPRIKNFVTSEEEAQLKVLLPGGQLKFRGWSLDGNGPHSRLIIVMQHQLDSPISLSLPAKSIIYFQDQSGWKSYPLNAQTIDSSIELYIPQESPARTDYWIQAPLGGRFGATAFTWDSRDP
jgi:hypothetical protein